MGKTLMDCTVSSSNFAPDYWSAQTIRTLEKRSIEEFVKENANYLKGRVLDFGAGKPGTCAKPQPYRQYISGEYVPYDLGDEFPTGSFDAILCTQVFQYLPDPRCELALFGRLLKPGGHLVMTYPTCWDEVEDSDLWRFTKVGMERDIDIWARIIPIKHERRAHIELKGFKFPLGYGVVARKPGIYTQETADESALKLTNKLKAKESFIYIRFGDGAIECINGKGKGTCDGELYSPSLATDLLACWQSLVADKKNTTYLGDWLSASFDEKRSGEYAEEYTKMVGAYTGQWAHYEALLFMRQSDALVDFYRTLAKDNRKIAYMGPAEMAPAINLLGCTSHIVTPMRDLYANIGAVEEMLNNTDFDVLLFGAGMAGTLPVIKHWQKHPEKTYIHLGSALDPLYRGKTRKVQLTKEQVTRALNGLL